MHCMFRLQVLPMTRHGFFIDLAALFFFLIQQWKGFSLVGLYVCLRVLMVILYTLNRIVHPI